MTDPAPIMIVAGEASGDLHGATLCRALRALAPERRLIGMGGPRMAAAGLQRLADVTAAAVIGGTEAFGPLPTMWAAWRRLKTALAAPTRPAALVLIDFPEVNLRLAAVARRAGIPVAYFIPPQVWAWRPWRVRAIGRRVSLVLAVFPFETALYRRAGVRVEFVGHPALDAVAGAPSRSEARRRLGLGADDLVIGVLPGSRAQEIRQTLPVMRAAAARIVAERPGARFVVALLGGDDASAAPTPGGPLDAANGTGPPMQVVRGQTYAVMRAADLLLVTSGTATLEAALLGTPMVVCYRFSRLTEAWVRLLVRVPWIALPSIVLGRAVVPELYQRTFTPERVAAAALAVLGSAAAREAQRQAFRELSGALGDAGVGVRAARHILGMIETTPASRDAAAPAMVGASSGATRAGGDMGAAPRLPHAP
jgi:lipid-A-disaccharide synthase